MGRGIGLNRSRSVFGLVWAGVGLLMTLAAIYLHITHQPSTELPALESFGPLFVFLGLFIWWYYRGDRKWPGGGFGP